MFHRGSQALVVLIGAGCLFAACAPAHDGYPRRAGATLPRCADTEPDGTRDLPAVPSTLVATIRPLVERTSDVEDDYDPSTERGEIFYTRTRGYGWYGAGAGEPRRLRGEIGGDAEIVGTRRTVAWIAVLSDVQLADDESPLRAAGDDSIDLRWVLRPHEAYVPRLLSAMNRTLAGVSERTRPFDVGVVTGDCTDSALLDELDWFVTIMDGGMVHPDSGADDDPVPGEDDPKDAFRAHAFPAPRLYVPGNHDTLARGHEAIDATLATTAIGDFAPRGTRRYDEWFAPVRTGTVVHDQRRELLTRERIAERLRQGAASPGPPGHGLGGTGAMLPNGRLSWTHDVVPGLVRLIALDTNDDTGGTNGLVRRREVDDFLVPALERARDEEMLVLLASHHALDKIDRREADAGAELADAVAPSELEALVASYGNVVAWLTGHAHEHRIVARGRTETTRGYWEVLTSGLADAPGQARVIEVLADEAGTVSLLATVIDWNESGCLERRARRLMFLDMQSGWATTDGWGRAEDRNVELRVPLADELARAVAARAAALPVGPLSDALGVR